MGDHLTSLDDLSLDDRALNRDVAGKRKRYRQEVLLFLARHQFRRWRSFSLIEHGHGGVDTAACGAERESHSYFGQAVARGSRQADCGDPRLTQEARCSGQRRLLLRLRASQTALLH